MGVIRWLSAAAIASMMGMPSISVKPAVIQANESLWVTCRVPPYTENRILEMGLEGYQASTRQLDGVKALITWRMLFERIPCGPDHAFCAVTTSDGVVTIARANVLVSGCGGSK